MDPQQADRLKALWRIGREKYRSFFAVLEEVRLEIGTEALPDWCFNELRISLSIILDSRKLLTSVDADIIKRNFAAALQAERDQRAAKNAIKQRERKEAIKAREEEAHQRKLEKIRRAKEIVEARSEVDKKERRRRKKKSTGKGKRRTPRKPIVVTDGELADLFARYKAADELYCAADEKRIEASIVKALLITMIRDKYPSNQEFGAGLVANGIDLAPHDRSALINLGRLGEERLREIFTTTDRQSYQYIWEEQRQLKVIEK